MKFKSILKKLILENSRFKVLYDNLVVPSEEALKKNPNAKGKLAGTTATKLNDQTNDLEQVELTPFQVLKTIIFADPTTLPCVVGPCVGNVEPTNFDIDGASLVDMEKVKIGEYTNWMLSYYAAKLPSNIKELDPKSPEYKKAVTEYRRLFIEDLPSITTDLVKFHQLKKFKDLLPLDKKDINKLTPKDLTDVCMNYQIPGKNINKQARKEAEKTQGDNPYSKFDCPIVYHGKDWVVVEINPSNPLARHAAVFYGGSQLKHEGESNWCTSAPGNALLKGEKGYVSNFDYYTTPYSDDINTKCMIDSPLYVILPTNDGGKISPRSGLPKDRYQFNFYKRQFMDLLDHQINLGEYFGPGGKMREIFDNYPKFQEEFARLYKREISSGNEVTISYPSREGLFEMFGIDSLFEKFSPNISTLNLINTSKDPRRAFDIPESIGRFKNLQAVVFDGSAKSIPNAITELTNLQFLSVINCPAVKTVPEGMADMDEFQFLSVVGSPNLKIPPRLMETLKEQRPGLYFKFF